MPYKTKSGKKEWEEGSKRMEKREGKSDHLAHKHWPTKMARSNPSSAVIIYT